LITAPLFATLRLDALHWANAFSVHLGDDLKIGRYIRVIILP
jgi:hypothetical protein